MLFNVNDLEMKKKAESGDQVALYDLAELYDKKYNRPDIAYNYFSKILEKECCCDPSIYLNSFLTTSSYQLDSGFTADALQNLQKAKVFMEQKLPEEEWESLIYVQIRAAKLILEREQKLESGGQQALYDLAVLYLDESLYSFEDLDIDESEIELEYDKAAKYLYQIIKQDCEIDKTDYLNIYVFLAQYEKLQDDYEAALNLLKKAKTFMEEHIPEQDWNIEIYTDIVNTKQIIVEENNT